MRITDCNQLLCGHDNQRESALQLRNRKTHGIFDRIGLKPCLCNQICNNFGIACCVENCAALFEHTAQTSGIAEIAVMHQRHFALLMIDLHRLTVAALVAAGCSVAGMADCHRTVRKAGEHLRRKDMIDQTEILVCGEYAVIVDRDAGSLLTAVLQCKQSAVGEVGKIFRLRRHDAEHAAFFMYFSHIIHPLMQKPDR